MRKTIILLLLILILFTSCVSSTKPYVEAPFADSSLSAEDKLISGGATHMALPEPECYFDAKEFLARYTEIVENAEDYILISTFLGSGCEGLEEFYSALAAKAEEGVDVYLILDAISSLDMTESKKYMYPLYFLKESGVHLIEYAPMSILRIIAPQNLIIRDHRKLV
ncbi:MAG: phosphatidylserine/phosphatidylglycerophosphate/cardiolipin synthase family protein, partial [Bullifex sp.]